MIRNSYTNFTIKLWGILLLIFIIYYFFYSSMEGFADTNNYVLPKKIFAYWDDLSKNNYIKYHFENWKRKFGPDWEINIITKETVSNYVSRNFIKKYKDLEPFRFSDFLRLELLRKNGGVWIDAGIIVKDGNFIDNFHQELLSKKSDALLFEYCEKTINKSTPHLDNWFIMAPKNSKLINDWFNQFDKAYEMGFLNYKFDILVPSGIPMKYNIGYGLDTYLMQHAIINYLMHTKKNYYNIIIKKAEDSMFKFQSKSKWDFFTTIYNIIHNIDMKDIYAIKLTRLDRNYITLIDEKAYIEAIKRL